MATKFPIAWDLGFRKATEYPIEEQPDFKKPKLDSADEDEKEDDYEEEDQIEVDGDEKVPIEVDEDEDAYWRNDKLYADNENGLHEMNPNECGEYFYHLNKSGGFDMPEFPNAIHYGIQRCDLSHAWVYVDVKNCSIFATKQRNEAKGTHYEYYRLVKVFAEIVSGSIYYITFLAEDLNRCASRSGGLENVPVGLNGGPLVELQAKVYLPIPKNAKMELMYSNVKDTLSEEGLKAHMQYQARLMKRVATK